MKNINEIDDLVDKVEDEKAKEIPFLQVAQFNSRVRKEYDSILKKFIKVAKDNSEKFPDLLQDIEFYRKK